jgi:CBS domain containing-hemolysin-like protein
MAEKGVTRMPVVERGTRTFLGLVSLNDLLKARTRHLEEERRRERTLKFRFFFPGRRDREGAQVSETRKM